MEKYKLSVHYIDGTVDRFDALDYSIEDGLLSITIEKIPYGRSITKRVSIPYQSIKMILEEVTNA